MSDFASRWPKLAEGAAKRRMGSVILQATALAHGLDTVRVNAESFVAGRDPLYTALGFWGPLSSETPRTAVRMTRDRVKRKSALSARGIRVPQSRRFGYNQVEEALAYAEKFSRGIIVKPRALSAGRVSTTPMTDGEKVRKVIQSWQKKPGSGSDYLVEARIAGPEHVFYIAGGHVQSVVRRRSRAWETEIYRHGASSNTEIHQEVLDLAVSVLKAFPGTPHGEVRIAGRNSLSDPARCRVVSVRPTIELTGTPVPHEWSLFMADQLIAPTLTDEMASLASTAQSTVQADFAITEVAEPTALAASTKSWFHNNGIDAEIVVSDREATGTISGTPGELASFAYLVRAGHMGRIFPQTVVLRQSG